MHNPVHLLTRSALRAGRPSTIRAAAFSSTFSRAAAVLAVVPAGLLVLNAGDAFAQGTGGTPGTAAVATNSVAFGLLGPVGLVAVAIGIVGMTLGVLRQRHKARVAVTECAEAVTTMAEAPAVATAGRPPMGNQANL